MPMLDLERRGRVLMVRVDHPPHNFMTAGDGPRAPAAGAIARRRPLGGRRGDHRQARRPLHHPLRRRRDPGQRPARGSRGAALVDRRDPAGRRGGPARAGAPRPRRAHAARRGVRALPGARPLPGDEPLRQGLHRGDQRAGHRRRLRDLAGLRRSPDGRRRHRDRTAGDDDRLQPGGGRNTAAAAAGGLRAGAPDDARRTDAEPAGGARSRADRRGGAGATRSRRRPSAWASGWRGAHPRRSGR